MHAKPSGGRGFESPQIHQKPRDSADFRGCGPDRVSTNPLGNIVPDRLAPRYPVRALPCPRVRLAPKLARSVPAALKLRPPVPTSPDYATSVTTTDSTASGANPLRIIDFDEQPRSAHLDERQVAGVLNVSVRTLQHWRYSGTGPQWVRFGRQVRYGDGALRAWVEAQHG